MYKNGVIRKSEYLQLILLDSIYAQTGSEQLIFQGGTALRWVYSGPRFSEDLDFVTHLREAAIEEILNKAFQKARAVCVAQFGPGSWEQNRKSGRKGATRVFFIYRPDRQRERIAVKCEFETLRPGHEPDHKRHVLRDLPNVAHMVAHGGLIMLYSSSIILAETIEEIFSDKIRALFERPYLKGRDIFDLWWMGRIGHVAPDWRTVERKLEMYDAPFTPAREPDYFRKAASRPDIMAAIQSDLSRFVPERIFSQYEAEQFSGFLTALDSVTSELMKQGMKGYFESHGSGKIGP